MFFSNCRAKLYFYCWRFSGLGNEINVDSVNWSYAKQTLRKPSNWAELYQLLYRCLSGEKTLLHLQFTIISQFGCKIVTCWKFCGLRISGGETVECHKCGSVKKNQCLLRSKRFQKNLQRLNAVWTNWKKLFHIHWLFGKLIFLKKNWFVVQ